MFKIIHGNLIRSFWIENGQFYERVRSIDDMHVIWCGVIPRVQFYRMAILRVRMDYKGSPYLTMAT